MKRAKAKFVAPNRRVATLPRVLLASALGALALAIFVLIAVAARFALSPQPENAVGPEDLAAEFSRAGEYQRAAETLRAAWRADPTESLRLHAARAFLIAGDEPGAIELLAAPAQGGAEDFARRHLLAEAYLRASRFDEAARAAAALREGAPRDGRARLLEARISYGLGDFEKSRDLAAEAIRLGGDALAEAWLFRARIALDADDLEAARAAARRAREAGAPAADSHAIEIEALLRAGETDGARAALGAFRSAAYAGDGALAERLQIHLDLCSGEAGDAARRLRAIAPLVDSAPYGILLLSRIASFAADRAQGEAALRRALSVAPDNPVLLAEAHERLIRASRFEEASALGDRLAVLDRNRAALARVTAALARDDADTAVGAALSASDFREPISTDAFLFGGKCRGVGPSEAERRRAVNLLAAAAAARDGTRSAASSAARSLVKGISGDAAASLLAAEIHLAVGDDAAARAEFERALKGSPQSVSARIGLVRIAARAGDFEEAAKMISPETATKGPAAIARARALAAAGRLSEAAEAIAPLADNIGADPDPESAAMAFEIFTAAGDGELARKVAESVRRARPDAVEAVRLLGEAGRTEEAIAAARAGVLAYPNSAERAVLYADVMMKAGRAGEAAAFIEELAARSSESAALAAARRVVDGESHGAEESGQSGEAAARRGYLGGGSRARSATALAMALSRIGEDEAAIRLAREACFWGGKARCE